MESTGLSTLYLLANLGLILISVLASPVISAPGWIRVCSQNEGTWELSSDECSRGIWFKNPFVVDCICVYGVWMLNRGFCDSLASLIVGTGQCFTFKEDWRQIRSIKYIGNPSDAFQSQILVGSKTLDFLDTVPKDGYYTPPIENSALILINTPFNVEGRRLNSPEQCFRSADSGAAIRIYFPITSTEFTIVNWGEDCVSNGNGSSTYHDLRFNEYYENNKVRKSDPLCTITCSKSRKSRQAPRSRNNEASRIPKNSKPKQTVQDVDRISKSATFSPGVAGRSIQKSKLPKQSLQSSTMKPRGRAFLSRRKHITPWPSGNWDLTSRKPYWKPIDRPIFYPESPVNCRTCINISNVPMTEEPDFKEPPLKRSQQGDIAKQTFRLMHGHLGCVLKNRTTAWEGFTEYQYLAYSRDIFLKLCPIRKVTLFVINSLFRMFTTILSEAVQDYPYSEDWDKSRIQAIKDGLKACLNLNRTALKLNYSPCKPKKVEYASLLLPNGSGLNINTTIPPILKFDLRKYDMAIELAWKVFTFSVYSCADLFQNKSSSFLHEYFILQTEQMFKNRKILMRWSNPGKSLEINRLLFNDFDLGRIAEEIDSCVVGAKAISVYPNWIQRKRRYDQRRKRSIDSLDEVWDGRGYCMQNYRDPIQKFGYQIGPGCSIPSFY